MKTSIHPARLYVDAIFRLPLALEHWQRESDITKSLFAVSQLMLYLWAMSSSTGFQALNLFMYGFTYVIILFGAALPLIIIDNRTSFYNKITRYCTDASLIVFSYVIIMGSLMMLFSVAFWIAGVSPEKQMIAFSVLSISVFTMLSMQFAESYSLRIGPKSVVASIIIAPAAFYLIAIYYFNALMG